MPSAFPTCGSLSPLWWGSRSPASPTTMRRERSSAGAASTSSSPSRRSRPSDSTMMRWRSRAKERTRGRRILFATDIHGSERCFRKFLNSAPLYDVDYLILGGDITGKLLVPIVRNDDGSYDCRYGEAVHTGLDEA